MVVGMMRSGTTLLQRVLASDPRLACAYGWEVGEPAPRPGWDPAAADPRIADAEAREEQMRTFAAELFAIHPTYVHEAEEEIVFLADAFLSHIPEASCDVPALPVVGRHAGLRARLPLAAPDAAAAPVAEAPARASRCGRSCSRRPSHLGYLDTLLAEFPDAHIVHTHRDPVDVIPSGASLNTTLWRTHCDDVDPHEVGRQWIERMGWTCDRAMAARARIPAAAGDRRRASSTPWPIRSAPPRAILAAVGLELTDESRRRHGGVDRPGPQARDAAGPPLHGRATSGSPPSRSASGSPTTADRFL